MADYESEEKALVLNTDLSHVLIVDGLPQVTEDKKDKLQTFTKKAFAKFGGKIVEPPGIHFPVENGKTIGLAFMEFEDSDTAKMMLGKIDNYRFDTKHTLRANLYSDYQAFSQIKEYIAPVAPVIETKTDLRSWLQDGFLRDQFVIRHSNQTEIFWNDPYRKANDQGRELCYNGSRQTQEQKFWTKLYVAWSPLGSYLATFHKEGIMLWGGRDFQLVARMPHQSVKWIDFSPKETYIVTSNGQDRTADSDDPDCVIVWDIRTGQKKRGFNRGFSPSWPIFKWSFDETYLARVEKDKIMIYETPDMGLLHKKAISAERVHEIQWSPTDYQLSYWIPELGTEAATVALLEIPSKRTLRDIHVHTNSHLCPRRSQTQSDKQQQQQQQQQQVQEKCTVFRPCRDCKVTMHWESQGAFLAVKLVRRKTKKKVQTSFHIVRLGDEKKQKKEIPVEVLDIDEPVCAFAWEPQGTRFGILSGEGTRYTARFYETKGPKLKLHVEVKERACNALFWSPRGNIVILAGLGSLNGQLEFYDVTAKETTAAMEHYMCTDIEWDPSGRFVITSVTQPLKSNTFYRYGSENGYKVWGMYGQVLANVRLDQLYQVMWRPRPKRLLTAEKEKEIKKQLKSRYFDRFSKEDEDIQSVIRGDAYESKKKMDEEWKAYREEKIREYADQKEERENLQEATEAELIDMDEVEEEEEIESTTEILQ